jgi:regulatory protein
MRLVGIRARSRHELLTRLTAAGFEASVAGEAVDRMAELGLIDDRSFAGEVVERSLRRGLAPARIRAELAAKGLAGETVEEALAAQGAGERENDLARAVALTEKKARALAGKEPAVVRRRIWSFLASKGFDPETAGEALRLIDLAGG